MNYVLHTPNVDLGLVYVSSLQGDDHTVKSTNRGCVAKEKNVVTADSERLSGMYSVNMQQAIEKASMTSDVTRNMISIWR